MAKLNIHLALDEQTLHFCREVNATIRRIAKSAIVFSDTSPMIPHITLVMGDFVPSQTFEGLRRATEIFTRQMKPLTLKLSKPYIDPLKRRFVLCDIEENLALTELRTMMRENILGRYLTTPYARPREPHITLAHIYARQEKVLSYLQSINEIPEAICSHIEISHVGSMGACVDSLFASHLAQTNDHALALRKYQLNLAGIPG